MKRAVVVAALIASILAGLGERATGSSAEPRLAHLAAAAPGDATQQLRERTCRYQWVDRGTWTAREERRTALCVLDHWSVPGGFETFDRVADCESHWWRFASNGGQFVGLFQHMASAWPGRVASYMPDGWKVGPWQRWQNSRSAIVTTAKMVHASGSWSAWACY